MGGGCDRLGGVVGSLGGGSGGGAAYVFECVVESFKVGLLSPVFDVSR